MSPAAIVAAALTGDMPVSHPTLYNLMELDASLQQHGSLQGLLRAESQRESSRSCRRWSTKNKPQWCCRGSFTGIS